ncbi:MAG TPA: hypothetical protein PLI90_06305 [Rhodocyclaceae bacterium]|nr:hypothetical protein [Rhodocyclaceae bacterium]
MVLSICNFRSTLVSKIENIRGIGFLCLMTAVVASAVFMTGCSSAVGTDLAPREDILKTLRAQGFVFNKNVISTVFGENQNQVIVSGQIAQKTPDNKNVTNGTKLTQYRKIIVENVDGTWKVISAPPLQREQFSSRQY